MPNKNNNKSNNNSNNNELDSGSGKDPKRVEAGQKAAETRKRHEENEPTVVNDSGNEVSAVRYLGGVSAAETRGNKIHQSDETIREAEKKLDQTRK
jgi:hypothetical protein